MYAIVSSYFLNVIFFILYRTVMMKDEYYNEWRDSNLNKERILVIAALLTSFQFYRLVLQELSKSIKITKDKKSGSIMPENNYEMKK